MRNTAESTINFLERVGDSAPAVNICGRFVTACNFGERHAFTENFAGGFSRLFPGKLRSVGCGVDVRQPAPSLAGGAHFTFMTTSVRSSERAAFSQNQPPPFRPPSALSPPELSSCFSLTF